MYVTPERGDLATCPHCCNRGNMNVERHEVLNGKLQRVGNGQLVMHCRSCGCNSEAR
jgi:hypothetical protein